MIKKVLPLVSMLLLGLQLYAQKIVEVGRSQTDYIEIASIQNAGSWTEVLLKVTPKKDMEATLHAPSGTYPFVLSDQKGNRYALKNQMGWNGPNDGGFGKRQLYTGTSFEVKLFFNKLPNVEDVYSLTEVSCDHEGCWNFYDIKLKDAPKAETVVTFDKVWVDYDVYDDSGRFGMRIHSKFSIENMKGITSYLSIRFMNEKDEFLTTTNTAFQNTLGQIALYRTLKPSYDSTLYSDQFVFMPYNEFKLAAGNYTLKYDVDLLDESGNLIKHFTLGNFTYTTN